MSRTRIFISSSSQRELQDLRATTYETLKDIGHEPVMWEKSFGPWPNSLSKTTIDKCLDEVEASDLFVLFISDKAGTYLEWDDSSVTHLELRKAFEERKETVVFVDTKVSSLYLATVKGKIEYAMKMEAETMKRAPELISVYALLQKMEGLPDGIDPYTWVILHDCYSKNIFMEALSLGVDIQPRIKEYLSARLKRGVGLLPTEARIKKNEEDAKEYSSFLKLSRELVLTQRTGNWRGFLNHLLHALQRAGGGEITRKVGNYRKETLTGFRTCSGISLYKLDQNLMVRVEYAGLAEGPAFFGLDEKSSFVSQAYLSGEASALFYREDKQTVYLAITAGVYVLCCHFELEEKWSQHQVHSFNQELFDGILWSHSIRNFIVFAQLLLGGE